MLEPVAAKKKTTVIPRTRRTAEEARAAILDAAEKHLAKVGPAGIRLQDVAAEVGLSHPAILHHFGDREGLMHAVIERAIDKLEDDLIAQLAGEPDPASMLAHVSATFRERGHARLVAWLLLSGYQPYASERSRANWKRIADITHASRTKALEGIATPSYEDTVFTLVFASLTLFGEALLGPSVFMSAGLDHDAGAPLRYRAWFAQLVFSHMAGVPMPP